MKGLAVICWCLGRIEGNAATADADAADAVCLFIDVSARPVMASCVSHSIRCHCRFSAAETTINNLASAAAAATDVIHLASPHDAGVGTSFGRLPESPL